MPCKHQNGTDPCTRTAKHECTVRRKEYCKEWKKANPAKVRASRKYDAKKASEYNRKRAYGLDAQAIRDLYAEQNGLCAACSRHLDFDRMHVDHCHDTKRVRGLLHPNCNTGVGLAENSPALLHAWADYLSAQGYL